MKIMASNVLSGRNSPAVNHPNLGYSVLVGGTSMARTLTETVFKLVGYNRVKFVPDMKSALQFLREVIAAEEITR